MEAKLNIPVPTLEHDFSINVDLEPRVAVGKGPWGHRNWINFTGGRFTSKWATGKLKPGGQDSQVVLADLSTRIETTYLIELDGDEPAYLVFKTTGWRTGPREVLEALADPARADSVDPSTYLFRLYIQLETGSEKYAHVNTGMWVGSGVRQGAKGMVLVTSPSQVYNVDVL